MNKRSICIVTGTRAEYGLLYPLIKKIFSDSDLELKLVVTGSHLSPEFGLTYKQIEKDGFFIDRKVEILLSSDTSSSINKSIGLTFISFGEYFEYTKPDMVMVLGDRYEIFAAAAAAAISRIPVAHIHGGETTEGATDEFLRHSITKMSYLHFASTEEYAKRIIQLGESPDRVFNVGALGVENINTLKLLSKKELENDLGILLDKPYALVTFHPVTLETGSAEYQFKELLKVLDDFRDMKFVITKSNADAEGRAINKLIDEYSYRNSDRVYAYTNLGQLRYLSAMKYCSFVLGNSSSGIIETPSFGIPTINIGDRQKGRVQAETVINCAPEEDQIKDAIMIARNYKFREKIRQTINPYGCGEVSEKILTIVKEFIIGGHKIDMKKAFYNVYGHMEGTK